MGELFDGLIEMSSRIAAFVRARWKAVAAFVGSMGAGYWQARADGSDGGGVVTGNELRDMLVAATLVAFAVWGIPNAATKPDTAGSVDKP